MPSLHANIDQVLAGAKSVMVACIARAHPTRRHLKNKPARDRENYQYFFHGPVCLAALAENFYRTNMAFCKQISRVTRATAGKSIVPLFCVDSQATPSAVYQVRRESSLPFAAENTRNHTRGAMENKAKVVCKHEKELLDVLQGFSDMSAIPASD